MGAEARNKKRIIKEHKQLRMQLETYLQRYANWRRSRLALSNRKAKLRNTIQSMHNRLFLQFDPSNCAQIWVRKWFDKGINPHMWLGKFKLE